MSGENLDQNVGKIAQPKDTVADQLLKGGSDSLRQDVNSTPPAQQKSMIDAMTGRSDEVPKNFVGTKDVTIADGQTPASGEQMIVQKDMKEVGPKDQEKTVVVGLHPPTTLANDTQAAVTVQTDGTANEPKSEHEAAFPKTPPVMHLEPKPPESESTPFSLIEDKSFDINRNDLLSVIQESRNLNAGDTGTVNIVDQVTKPK